MILLRGVAENVKSAAEIMDRSIRVLDASLSTAQLRDIVDGDQTLRYDVVSREGKVEGWLRVDAPLRSMANATSVQVTLGWLAQSNYVLVHESYAASTVIQILSNRPGQIAVVVRRGQARDARHVLGVIVRDHIAAALSNGSHTYHHG
jgi:CIC family chloride channel protein